MRNREKEGIMLFFSDIDPQGVCILVGPDGTNCIRIGL
jgi:hypothetical protein